jgi:hypothetical protein
MQFPAQVPAEHIRAGTGTTYPFVKIQFVAWKSTCQNKSNDGDSVFVVLVALCAPF